MQKEASEMFQASPLMLNEFNMRDTAELFKKGYLKRLNHISFKNIRNYQKNDGDDFALHLVTENVSLLEIDGVDPSFFSLLLIVMGFGLRRIGTLIISNQKISAKQTEHLLNAMKNVQKTVLGLNGPAFPDIDVARKTNPKYNEAGEKQIIVYLRNYSLSRTFEQKELLTKWSRELGWNLMKNKDNIWIFGSIIPEVKTNDRNYKTPYSENQNLALQNNEKQHKPCTAARDKKKDKTGSWIMKSKKILDVEMKGSKDFDSVDVEKKRNDEITNVSVGRDCTGLVVGTQTELGVAAAVSIPVINNEHQTRSFLSSLDDTSNINTGSIKKEEKTEGFDLILQDFRCKKDDKKGIDIVYELKEILGTPSDIFQNFLREATKEKVDIKTCLLLPEKKRNCLVSTVLGTLKGENENDTDFFVSQYEESSEAVSKNFLIIEVLGTNPVDLTDSINKIDQMVENTASTLQGYLQRRLECLEAISPFSKRDFLRSQDIKSIAGFKTLTEKNLNNSKSNIQHVVDEGGNFKDFEELSFEGKEKSKIYFNGALKISSTTFESQFDFRGRIARDADFEAVTSYLRSEENMVSIVHKISWPLSLLLWQVRRLH